MGKGGEYVWKNILLYTKTFIMEICCFGTSKLYIMWILGQFSCVEPFSGVVLE